MPLVLRTGLHIFLTSWEVVWGSSPWDPASLVVVVVPKVEGNSGGDCALPVFTTRPLFTSRVTLGDSGSVISVLSFASGVACRATLASATMSPGGRVPPLPPPRPVPPPTLPSSPPVVGLDREASEEDKVKDRDREEEKGDIKSKNRETKVVDWGNSETVSSGANSDGPENGT